MASDTSRLFSVRARDESSLYLTRARTPSCVTRWAVKFVYLSFVTSCCASFSWSVLLSAFWVGLGWCLFLSLSSSAGLVGLVSPLRLRLGWPGRGQQVFYLHPLSQLRPDRRSQGQGGCRQCASQARAHTHGVGQGGETAVERYSGEAVGDQRSGEAGVGT